MIEFIASAPVWLKIVIIIISLYLLTWFPRIIGTLNRILRELSAISKKLDKQSALLQNLVSEKTNRETANMFANLFSMEKTLRKKEETEDVSE